MKTDKELLKAVDGVCIKSYHDEDDITDFEEGRIEEEDIHFYNVGDEGKIVKGLYDPEFWVDIETYNLKEASKSLKTLASEMIKSIKEL